MREIVFFRKSLRSFNESSAFTIPPIKCELSDDISYQDLFDLSSECTSISTLWILVLFSVNFSVNLYIYYSGY